MFLLGTFIVYIKNITFNSKELHIYKNIPVAALPKRRD